jgi:hypothetical protein
MGNNALHRAACNWAVSFALVALVSGCGDDRPPPSTDGAFASVGQQPVEAEEQTGDHMFPVGSSCTSGRTAACKVVVGRHAHIVNCFAGVQHCVDDAWGPCVEGDAGAEGQ